MDSVGSGVDSGSPRRGSLTSLHRQSSGSFSHGTRLAATTTQINSNNSTNNLNNLYKDLDKFTRYFIVKSVQVIVQSRINGSRRLRTECKPSGNDWFNINIADIVEVNDQTKAVLDCDRLSVKSDWRVCCEISLRTSDGSRLVLEHWIISNKSNLNSGVKRGNITQQILPGKNQLPSNRSPPIHLTTSNNTGIGVSNATNSSVGRVRTATFSNTMRTRLNSIDDCSGDNNKLPINTVNENFDMKPSTSCFSLASSSANQTTDHLVTTTTIAASPSISSLNNINNTTSHQQQHHNQSSKASAMSSIYTIYNRMSLLLKTLMTTTHIVPAYRLASSTSPSDPCVICYRIYSAPFNNSNTKTSPSGGVVGRGSIEDLSHNADSPNRRSLSSNSSFGSVNIREFVSPEELDHFGPMLKLGSIKSEINELDISLCYRTDDKRSNHMMQSPRGTELYSKILDEDCITAAKQLLAGNKYEKNNNNFCDNTNDDAGYNNVTNGQEYNYIDRPLKPAFAAKEPKLANRADQDPNMSLIDSAFEGLLRIRDYESTNGSNKPADESNTRGITAKTDSHSKNTHSDPIQVPNGSLQSKHMELYQNASAGSTPKSLTDSFVFVDLNPPFASEEQNDLNSFFHGPSPTFNNNGFDNFKDVDELANQLAVIEASASQVDEFVDNICVSEDDEEEE